jgi:carboxypeptidase family protein
MRVQRSEKALRYVLAASVLFLTVFLSMCLPATAQVVTGSLSGTVTDQTGALVSGAMVTLTNEATNATQKATTSASGAFRFTVLPVGKYTIEVSKEGFRKLKVQGAGVDTNSENTLGALKLQVGETSESVEVTAAPPLVESAQAQVTTAVTGEELQSFAGTAENQGLDFIALTLPGVGASRDDNFANQNGVGFSVNGIRGRNNDQQIDGENNNDNSVAGPALFMSDPEFVSEYQATTSNFGPEFGRNSGSVINVVTKSGTNHWHGSVFGQETNAIFTTLTNTETDFTTPAITRPPRFNSEFSGGTVGGPLRKDKVFIFGGFDDQILSSKITDVTGLLTPTPLGLTQLAGCFPGSPSVAALQAFGPYGVGGGSPTVSGTPTNLTSGGCTYQAAGVQRTVPNGFHEYDWISKLDVHATNSDSISMRYFFQKEIFFNDEVAAGAQAEGYPVNVPSLGQSALADWTHTFSNRLLNELRFGYSRNNVQFASNTLGTIPTANDVSQALTTVGFTATNLLGYGPPAADFPQGRIVDSYQLQDNFSFTMGRHQLKWGANITNQRSPNVFLPTFNGGFTYTDFGGYAANTPFEVAVVKGSPNFDFKEWDTFLYVGDDWKVKSNLTLNLGLTWSYLGQPANIFHQETVTQQSSANPLWNPNLPASATTSPAIGSVHDLFGPSIGFAWSPNFWGTGNGKTVLRGGYRLTYDPAYYNIFLGNASSAPVVLNQTFPTTNVPNPPGITSQPFGPAIRAEYSPLLPVGQLDPRNSPETVTPPTLRPDKVHEWSFGIQRELSSHAAFEVRYVGNHSENGFQTVNVNPDIAGLAALFPAFVPAGATPCADPTAPGFGRINCNAGIQIETGNTAFSNYNGLQAEFRTTNLFKQLTLRTNYTWSKTLDNTSEIFNTFAAGNSETLSQNPSNLAGGEYGLSGLDFPQTWNLTFIEDVPFMRSQHGLLGKLVGGWQLSGTYTLQSGQGYTPTQVYTNFASYAGNGSNGIEDSNFNFAFNNTVPDVVRPFVGSLSAPANQVGIYAGDACAVGPVIGNGWNSAAVCGAAANQLISLNQINAAIAGGGTAPAVPVTNSQVRLIANGAVSDAIFGTPFGNAGRNMLRDFHTDIGNFSLYKNFRFSERATVQWHMTMNNVFNHPNYGNTSPGINPFIENAGVPGYQTTFATPQVESNATFSCPAGTRCIFFGVKVLY